jgi:CheY-like chemotaxis protein
MSTIGNVVMVIEDEELLLQAITKKLKDNGFDTISCAAASQALEYLGKLPELPDLIWLDYYLKDMNGLEFMDKLNENNDWSRIPVIVVSNSASSQKVDAMMAKGVKKYLLKASYRLEDLVKIVKEYTKKDGEV